MGNSDKGRIFAGAIHVHVWECAANVCADTSDFGAGVLSRQQTLRVQFERHKEVDSEFAIYFLAFDAVPAGIFLLAGVWHNGVLFRSFKDLERASVDSTVVQNVDITTRLLQVIN